MAFPEVLETFFNRWADLMWGTPLVVLLVGGGPDIQKIQEEIAHKNGYKVIGHSLVLYVKPLAKP